MNPKLKLIQKLVEDYAPTCEQEALDREEMLRFLSANDDCLERKNKTAHFTASSWIVNEAGDKVLMVYHNIYDSWSWTAEEETGASGFRFVKQEPVSLEIITVDGHEKRGVYVPSHLHLNLTYLLTAEEGHMGECVQVTF